MTYVLRYQDGTDLNDRKHKYTLPKSDSYMEAFNALELVPEYFRDKLEIVQR